MLLIEDVIITMEKYWDDCNLFNMSERIYNEILLTYSYTDLEQTENTYLSDWNKTHYTINNWRLTFIEIELKANNLCITTVSNSNIQFLNNN